MFVFDTFSDVEESQYESNALFSKFVPDEDKREEFLSSLFSAIESQQTLFYRNIPSLSKQIFILNIQDKNYLIIVCQNKKLNYICIRLGQLAQLVQSTSFTPRGSGVRIPQRPQKVSNFGNLFLLVIFKIQLKKVILNRHRGHQLSWFRVSP